MPDSDGSVLRVSVVLFTNEGIKSHRREPVKPFTTKFQHYITVEDRPSDCGIWRRYNVVPQQCNEMISAYGEKVLSETPNSFDLS